MRKMAVKKTKKQRRVTEDRWAVLRDHETGFMLTTFRTRKQAREKVSSIFFGGGPNKGTYVPRRVRITTID